MGTSTTGMDAAVMDAAVRDGAVIGLAESYRQWRIGAGRTGQVLPQRSFREGSGRNHNLRNDEVAKFLQWEHQTWGINLGWTDDGTAGTGVLAARWFFTRPSNGTGPITYGETIAIGNGTVPSFVKFQERTFGINLGYSDDPHYEWKLLGGTPGEPVSCGDRVAIYNVRATSATVPGLLRYSDRAVGGDLGWPEPKTWAVSVDRGLPTEELKKQVIRSLGKG